MRRNVERPRQNKRDGKSNYNQDNDETDNPVGNFENRKDLRGDLDNEPGHDRIRDRDPINFAPFELAKEIPHDLTDL